MSSPTGLPVGLKGEPAAGKLAFEAEGAEGAMDVAAGADALDDLLAEVAALGEVQGAGLAGLLGEFAVADVDAVEWRSFEDSEMLEALRGRRGRLRLKERLEERSQWIRASAQTRSGDKRAVSVDDGDCGGVPRDVIVVEFSQA